MYALDCHAVKRSSMLNGFTPGWMEYGLSNPSGAAVSYFRRNCFTLPPNWNLRFDEALSVASYLIVVSDSVESVWKMIGLESITWSAGVPAGGTPSRTRSLTVCPTLATEVVTPSRPTARDPNRCCQFTPVALRHPWYRMSRVEISSSLGVESVSPRRIRSTPVTLTAQRRSVALRSYTALAFTVYRTGTPPSPISFVNKSRKLLRAETTHDPRPLDSGPSTAPPAPANPTVARAWSASRLPSRSVICNTLDVRLVYEAGYPPVRNVTSRIIETSTMLTVPPADAKLEKVLMFGTSTLSMMKRFSSGLPPRTMMSLRKSSDPMTTPGRVCM